MNNGVACVGVRVLCFDDEAKKVTAVLITMVGASRSCTAHVMRTVRPTNSDEFLFMCEPCSSPGLRLRLCASVAGGGEGVALVTAEPLLNGPGGGCASPALKP